MSVFPFHLESHLAFYLVVYVLTLVLHAIFMTYVLAGSLFLAWTAVFPGAAAIPRAQSPLAKILREWMPFALSAAITAGVAPLLFVQIIYRQQFYTSNLLLGWRWMIVVPVLIVGFYLLYIVKSKLITTWSLPLRTALVAAVSGCFVFVAFCWTANHLLAIDHTRWAEVYSTGNIVAATGPLVLRLMTWIIGAFPCMCAMAAWQLAYRIRQQETATSEYTDGIATLAKVSIGGILVSAAFGIAYITTLAGDVRSELLSSTAAVWFMSLAIGSVLQLNAWWQAKRCLKLTPSTLLFVSGGVVLSVTGTAFLREIVRFSHVDVPIVVANTEAAMKVGGFALFIGFTIMNIGLMAFCIRLVSKVAKPIA